MLGQKKEEVYACNSCGRQFSNFDVPRNCSNCFACTGCEIYLCPFCGEEVVVKPIKKHDSSKK